VDAKEAADGDDAGAAGVGGRQDAGVVERARLEPDRRRIDELAGQGPVGEVGNERQVGDDRLPGCRCLAHGGRGKLDVG
jgi:hypothetical protein